MNPVVFYHIQHSHDVMLASASYCYKDRVLAISQIQVLAILSYCGGMWLTPRWSIFFMQMFIISKFKKVIYTWRVYVTIKKQTKTHSN